MTLLALLRHHGDVIEADVQREYGVDLTDLWRGTLSLRRVRVLIDGLPTDSVTAYALSGAALEPVYGWRLTDLLLGRLADELALYRWQWEGAHSERKHGHRGQPPSVLPELPSAAPARPDLRVVSPHALGSFVHDTEEVTPHGL